MMKQRWCVFLTLEVGALLSLSKRIGGWDASKGGCLESLSVSVDVCQVDNRAAQVSTILHGDHFADT